MKFNPKIKVMVDVAMTVLLLVLMAYHITGNRWHEWLGVTLCLLFITHNILNWNWYRALFKGRYTPARFLHTSINFLLLAAMFGMIISGVMISHDVLGFLNIKTSHFGRRLHMISASWGLVLMSLHLGLHWGMVVSAARKRINKNAEIIPTFILQLVAAALSVYGVYAFISREIWQKMFLLIDYAFFNYEEAAIFFFADYIAIMSVFVSTAYYTIKLMRKKDTAYANYLNQKVAGQLCVKN